MKSRIATIFFTVLSSGIVLLLACSKPSDQEMMDRAETCSVQADSLLRSDNPEAAEKQFVKAAGWLEKLIETYPESPHRLKAHYDLSMICTSVMQDYDRAVSLLRQAIVQYPDSNISAKYHFLIGYIYHNYAGDTLKAREAYNRFMDVHPDHEMAESVKWELENLGKDIEQIPGFENLEQSGSGGRTN